MLYNNLRFTAVSNRPFFYTNFVQTLDGKVQVRKEGLPAGRQGYWPIGSKLDHQVLEELRLYADCLIHGGNLAREFGEITLKSINQTSFKQQRQAKGKTAKLPYYVITHHPQSLTDIKANIFSGKLLVLVNQLQQEGYQYVLVEGGPTLLASFFKEDLIDEIFLTIAPKIFGNQDGSTLTLVEGYLFPPDKIKRFKLVSVKQKGDEVFLRYRTIR